MIRENVKPWAQVAGFVLGCLAFNVYFAMMSWQQIRDSVSWIVYVKQKNDIKIRHIVQFTPQILLLCWMLFYRLKVSLKSTLLVSLAVGTIYGFVSELVQLYVPGRIFAAQDIFWNIWATSLAVVLFYMYQIFGPPQRKNSLTSEVTSVFFLLLTIFTFSFSSLFNVDFYSDAFRLLNAANHPANGTFEHWWNIFTGPTNGGAQYRPISYYLFFYVIQNVVPVTPLVGSGIAAFLLAVCSTLFYMLACRILGNRYLSLFLAIVMMMSPFYILQIEDMQNVAKYPLPLISLLSAAYMIETIRPWTLRATLATVGLCFVSLLCHEGSLVFAPVLLGWYWVRRGRLPKSMALLCVPAASYLVMRIFVWGIPLKGFMRVSLLKMPFLMPLHAARLYTIDTARSSLVGAVCLGILFVVGYRLRDKRFILYCLFAQFFLLLPYSVLENHFRSIHNFWCVPFVFLSFGLFLQVLSERLPQMNRQWTLRTGMAIIALVSVFGVFKTFKNSSARVQGLNVSTKGLFEQVKVESSKTSDLVLINMDDADFENARTNSNVTAEALAHYYPDRSFVVQSSQSDQRIYVEKGMVYRIEGDSNGELTTVDPYNQRWTIQRDLSQPAQRFTVRGLEAGFSDAMNGRADTAPLL